MLGEGTNINKLFKLVSLLESPILSKALRRLITAILSPLLIICLLLAQPEPSNAARGGRIGGGNFRAPSIPRTSGYGGGYRGGYGGYGGYRGGIGFPFILPFFGFGGGGLFGFLILMAITGVIVNSVRGITSSTNPTTNNFSQRTQIQPPVTIIQLQIGLLAKAKSLQDDLREIAANSNTSSPQGLQKVLQETTLALLRQPDLWVYSNAENGSVPFTASESTFNRLSMSERSKLQAEITSNVFGEIKTQINSTGEADDSNEFIAVTLLIASKNSIKIPNTISTDQLKECLQILGSISSSDLMALEVIWQPEGKGDSLSAEDLVTSYPNLKHL